jgi:hypothetical protein
MFMICNVSFFFVWFHGLFCYIALAALHVRHEMDISATNQSNIEHAIRVFVMACKAKHLGWILVASKSWKTTCCVS